MASKEENINMVPEDFIPSGLFVVDEKKNLWIIGKKIGEGGCGRVYLVSNDINKQVSDDAPYVIKVTLECSIESCFYTGFPTCINLEKDKTNKNLKDIFIPKHFGFGCFSHKKKNYGFVILERFVLDLQTILDNYKTLSYKTAYQVAIQILDVLEVLHFYEYVHSDIKAPNIMFGYRPGTGYRTFLIDYGLSKLYTLECLHKEYLEKMASTESKYIRFGTKPFTSRDSHCRAHTRRGDVESLSFNLIKWICGHLPWEENYEDLDSHVNKKFEMMDDVPKFLNICFPDGAPPGIQEFVEYVKSLSFEEMPDFKRLRGILENHLNHDNDEKDTYHPRISQFFEANEAISLLKV